MVKSIEDRLIKQGKKNGLTGSKLDTYVYNKLNKIKGTKKKSNKNKVKQ